MKKTVTKTQKEKAPEKANPKTKSKAKKGARKKMSDQEPLEGMDFSIIKKIAREKKITLKELAERMGMTRSTLFRIIKTNSTKLPTLLEIAKELGVSGAVFFVDKPEPAPAPTPAPTPVSGDISEILAQIRKKDEQISSLLELLKQQTEELALRRRRPRTPKE